MRHFLFFNFLALPLAACLVAGAGTLPASAQTGAETQSSSASVKPADTLDSLFSQLKREPDEQQAKRISERIWAEWRDSGSATVNLLMQWANKAIADSKNGLALDLLDQTIVLMPDYVEGWNRRATLHFMMGNHGKSMADINRVLTLEPRHFGHGRDSLCVGQRRTGAQGLGTDAGDLPGQPSGPGKGGRTGRQACRQQNLICLETFFALYRLAERA